MLWVKIMLSICFYHIITVKEGCKKCGNELRCPGRKLPGIDFFVLF